VLTNKITLIIITP